MASASVSVPSAGRTPETVERRHDEPADASSRESGQALLTKGTLEWGFFGNVGVAHDWFGAVSDPEFVAAGGYIGRVVSSPRGRGLFRGNLAAQLEVQPLFVMFQPTATYALSFTVIGKHYLETDRRFRPFLTAGVGMLFSRMDVPADTSRLNFTPQLGIGVAFFHTKRSFYTIEYRLHHTSNANLAERNPGINSSFVQIGLGFLR
jgi:hypothetical protein